MLNYRIFQGSGGQNNNNNYGVLYLQSLLLNISPEIGEIIEEHFSGEEIEEIKNNFFHFKNLKKKSSQNLKVTNNWNLENDFNFNLDLFLTYAKSYLPKNKFIILLSNIGDFYLKKGKNIAAEDIFNQSIKDIHNSKELLPYKANAFLSLAVIYSDIAKWKISINYLNKSLSIFKKLNDIIGVAKCENLFGTIYGEMGNLLKAKNYFEESLKKLVDYDDYEIAGKIEINLGIINLIQGDLVRASSYLKKSLALYSKLKDVRRIAQIRMNLGILAIKRKDYSKGLKEIDKALKISQENELENIECLCLCNKANALIKNDNVYEAESILPLIKNFCLKLSDKLSLAEYYRLQGLVFMHYENYQTSEQYLLTSIRLNKEFENSLNAAETNIDLAILYEKMNNKKESFSLFREAFYFFKSINASVELNLLLKHM